MGVPILPPAGITAAALWAPSAFVDQASPPAIGAEQIDPSSGELTSVFAGRPPVVAALINQLRIVRSSGAAVTNDGHRFKDIQYNDATAPAKIRFEIDRIFKPFLARGDIAVDTIEVQAGEDFDDLGAAFVVFRDLRSKRSFRLDRSAAGTFSLTSTGSTP